MVNSNSYSLLLLSLLFIFFLSFSLSSATDNSKTYKNCFSKIFAFGDSFTDTGNAHSLGGLTTFSSSIQATSPYGTSFFNGSTTRLSDGRLIIDFLCQTLSLPYLSAYKGSSANFSHGVNFAVSGSTALSSDYYVNNKVGRTITWKPIPESLQTQLNWFYEYVEEAACKGKGQNTCKVEMGDALFWVGEMGMVDYSRTFGSSFSIQSLQEMIVDSVCKLLKMLMEKGAKYIVVQGLPPTGCFPLDLSMSPSFDRDDMGCATSANSVIISHNNLLQKKLQEIQNQSPGASIIYADYWNAYRKILQKPEQYGFQEPYKACCGAGDKLNFDLHALCGETGTTKCEDPKKYINWDGIHLTEAMYEKLSDLFFNQGFLQPSFDQLLKSKKCMK